AAPNKASTAWQLRLRRGLSDDLKRRFGVCESAIWVICVERVQPDNLIAFVQFGCFVQSSLGVLVDGAGMAIAIDVLSVEHADLERAILSIEIVTLFLPA